jgi:3',5'-cyclic AMP phosphodiesterase CpdA
VKKIIHLSDLHIGYSSQKLETRFNAIVNNIIMQKQPAEQFVILITGDLVERATDHTSHDKAKEQIERLESSGFRVLVVPGNHDYGNGAVASARYMRRFKRKFYGDENFVFPRLDFIDSIAFIGLDSMEEELHTFDKLGANGEVGPAQRERLDNLLAGDDVKHADFRVVYWHHHPFDPWFLHELKDAKELSELLQKHGNVDAIMFGHNHNFRHWHGEWGIRRCYDAGSSTRKSDLESYVRVIDLSLLPRGKHEADLSLTADVFV